MDTSFGTSGITTTDFGTPSTASSSLILSNGKIIATGTANVTSSSPKFALARYNASGALAP